MVIAGVSPYRRSALHAYHLAHSDSMVDVGNWSLPSHYGSVKSEGKAATDSCAIVDISAIQLVIAQGREVDRWLADIVGVNSVPPIGQSMRFADGVVMRLTADQALLRGTSTGSESLDRIFEHEDHGGVVMADVTAGYTGIALIGPGSSEVLSTRTQSDVSPHRFEEGSTLQSGFAAVRGTLRRGSGGASSVYELYVSRQFGLYVWEQLLRPLRRVGGTPAGWETWVTFAEDASTAQDQARLRAR